MTLRPSHGQQQQLLQSLTVVLDHPLPNGYFLLAVSERTVGTLATFLPGKIPTNGKLQVAWDRRRQTR